MLCQSCGTQNTNNSAFCMNCGTSLNNVDASNVAIKTNEIPPIQQQQFNNNVKNVQPKKSKKTILIIIGIMSIVLMIVLVLWFKKQNNNNNYGVNSQKDEISYSYSEGNVPKFIDGSFSSDTINSSKDVLKALESIKDEMNFKDISKELKLSSEETSDDITYYKFEQIYNDVPVYKQNIIVMVDKQGKINGLSGYYIPNIDIQVTPQKTKEDIEIIIKNTLGENTNIMSNKLYVWAEYENMLSRVIRIQVPLNLLSMLILVK